MTLSFQTKMKDQTQTNFVQRIWDGLLLNDLATEEQFKEYAAKFDWWYWPIREDDTDRRIAAKIHTIREDKNDRWKIGMPIHFVINNRRPDRLQFAPVIQCVSTQRIRIEKELIDPSLPKDYKGWNIKKFDVWIDGDPFPSITPDYNGDLIELLAHQDGFLFEPQFVAWWPVGVFEGKIIHWTNYRYQWPL